MKFDELNKLFKAYFNVMDISEEDKRKREECAFFFYDAVWYVLTMIRLELKHRELDEKASYIRSLYYRIRDILEDSDVEFDEDYLNYISEEIIDTTFLHLEDEAEDDEDIEENYFLSERRAILIAQNEANAVLNASDFKKAKLQGKKYKVWLAELDDRTRPWHREVDGKKVPIDEYFPVGNDLMLYPHDINGSPENIVNCRCSCKYE